MRVTSFVPATFSNEIGSEMHGVSFVPATFSNEKDRVRNNKKAPFLAGLFIFRSLTNAMADR